MRRIPKYVWLVAAAVVVVAVIAVVVWQDSYKRDVVREWASLQKCTAELDGKIATGGCDFSDIKEKSGSLKSIVETTKKRFSVTTVPPGKAATNFYFVDYLDKTILALDSICINCDTWSAAEMSKLKQHTEEMRNAQLECANRIGRSGNNQLFISTATTLNRMHDKRSPKVASTTGTIVIASSSSPSFSVPTDPAIAGYVSNMRSLIARYMSLRDSLNAFINQVDGGGSPFSVPPGVWVSASQDPVFQSNLGGRDSLVAEMDSMLVPAQYQNFHSTIRNAIDSAATAMRTLAQTGDYRPMRQVSNSNTALMTAIGHY